jgi:hypothetical protein
VEVMLARLSARELTREGIEEATQEAYGKGRGRVRSGWSASRQGYRTWFIPATMTPSMNQATFSACSSGHSTTSPAWQAITDIVIVVERGGEVEVWALMNIPDRWHASPELCS